MYIFEKYNDEYSKIFATKELALREAVKMIKEDNSDDTQKSQEYNKLMEQYFDPNRTDFYIADLFWVYEAEVIDK